MCPPPLDPPLYSKCDCDRLPSTYIIFAFEVLPPTMTVLTLVTSTSVKSVLVAT